VTLLVFSDDWGRHPTSCQHLIRHVLPDLPVVWVNTIGMRRPKLEWYSVRRGFEKFGQWLGPRPGPAHLPANLRVVSPVLWPGFGRSAERWVNRALFLRRLRPVVEALAEPPVAVTTMPTVADLIGRLPVRKWVYYCVDDFTSWPGLDGPTVERLEAALIERADTIIAVSEHLCRRIAARGRAAHLLTHGVDLEFWRRSAKYGQWAFPRPWVLFWGLVDRRMCSPTLAALSAGGVGTVILVGPEDNADPAVARLPNVQRVPMVRTDVLPAMAAAADVLILPYADLPVTRAIQPLKLKEYLATGKPVVAADLPAVREWAGCLDVAASPGEFVEAVRRRAAGGVPPDQVRARAALRDESWQAKAERFRELVLAEPRGPEKKL
jgi:glycosyltransferase involved in cell wall biosynthesis